MLENYTGIVMALTLTGSVEDCNQPRSKDLVKS